MKLILAMRTDLGMRKGKMVAQGGHASMMPVLPLLVPHPDDCSACEREHRALIWKWVESGMRKICVGVGSLEEIEALEHEALEAGVLASIVTDRGDTEFHGKPTVTCIAIGPAENADIDPITRHLKLL